jgi:transcriptional regulator with XRE-family HTH domain
VTQLIEGSRTGESISDLREEFQDEEYRYAYAEDFLNTWVATQIVTLREQRRLSQTELGELIGTKQPGISRLEDVNHSTWKTETLKRLARALGVRLKITFETFGSLLDEDDGFNREFLKRPEFKDDPVFKPDKRKPAKAEAGRSAPIAINESGAWNSTGSRRAELGSASGNNNSMIRGAVPTTGNNSTTMLGDQYGRRH